MSNGGLYPHFADHREKVRYPGPAPAGNLPTLLLDGRAETNLLHLFQIIELGQKEILSPEFKRLQFIRLEKPLDIIFGFIPIDPFNFISQLA